MAKRRELSPVEMMQQVSVMEAKAAAKRQKEQAKIDTLKAKIERAKQAEEAGPILLGHRPSVKIPKKLEDEIIEKARESLRMYGTVVPPQDVQLMTQEAECPHCHRTGLIPIMFGFKKYKNAAGEDEIRPQSWCRDCRNGKDSHPTRNKR